MNGIITQTARVKNGLINIYTALFVGGENISPTPAIVVGLMATNKGASTIYLQLFDSKAAPSGAPTFPPIAVAAGATVTVNYNDGPGDGALFGVSTSTGLTWGASSTPASYTADTTDCAVQIRYFS